MTIEDRVTFNMRMPADLVEKLDDAAQTLGVSRTAFITMVCYASVGDSSQIKAAMSQAMRDAVRESKSKNKRVRAACDA